MAETNHPAVALWRSLSFEILTTAPEASGQREDGHVGLRVMYRRLKPPAATS